MACTITIVLYHKIGILVVHAKMGTEHFLNHLANGIDVNVEILSRPCNRSRWCEYLLSLTAWITAAECLFYRRGWFGEREPETRDGATETERTRREETQESGKSGREEEKEQSGKR